MCYTKLIIFFKACTLSTQTISVCSNNFDLFILQKINYMQKSFFLKITVLAATLFISIFSFAQISVGAKGGLNLSNLNGINSDNYETKGKIGFHLGGFVTFNLGRNFAIQPELVYSTQGGTIDSGNITQDIDLNYFNIPVMVKFLTNSGFYLEAGPKLGFRTGDVDNNNIPGSVENSDFSICGGLGFQPTKSAFGFGARYNAGMGKTGEIDTPSLDNVDYKNGVLQLSLYWRIFGGGKLKK